MGIQLALLFGGRPLKVRLIGPAAPAVKVPGHDGF